MLALYLSLIGAAGAALAAFGAVDAKAAFDNKPETVTLSEMARQWRRESPWHFAALAAGLLGLAAVPVVLALHLLADLF